MLENRYQLCKKFTERDRDQKNISNNRYISNKRDTSNCSSPVNTLWNSWINLPNFCVHYIWLCFSAHLRRNDTKNLLRQMEMGVEDEKDIDSKSIKNLESWFENRIIFTFTSPGNDMQMVSFLWYLGGWRPFIRHQHLL